MRTGAGAALTGSGAVGSAKRACAPVIVWASRSVFAEDEARRQVPLTAKVEGFMTKKGVRSGGVREHRRPWSIIPDVDRYEAILQAGLQLYGPTKSKEVRQLTCQEIAFRGIGQTSTHKWVRVIPCFSTRSVSARSRVTEATVTRDTIKSSTMVYSKNQKSLSYGSTVLPIIIVIHLPGMFAPSTRLHEQRQPTRTDPVHPRI